MPFSPSLSGRKVESGRRWVERTTFLGVLSGGRSDRFIGGLIWVDPNDLTLSQFLTLFALTIRCRKTPLNNVLLSITYVKILNVKIRIFI